MNIEKQKLLLSYLISSNDTYALCASILKPSYFDPELRSAVGFIKTYYSEYNATPEPNQIKAETLVELEKETITKDQINYCSNQIEEFCQMEGFKEAVLELPTLMDDQNLGPARELIDKALGISLNKDVGLNYSLDPEERLRRLANSEVTQSTKWKEFDKLLDGGLVRKQMLLMSANSGGGKSIAMANLGLNYVEQGLCVCYITLELSEEMVSLRYDSMVTGIEQAGWQYRIGEISNKISSAMGDESMGDLHIKYMNAGSTSNDIRSYLKEFELVYGHLPDMLIVDYLDLMGSDQRISVDNVFEKDKAVSEQLRNIGNDYNMFIVTASQQNRSAVGTTDLNHSHIAGGISKINTTDVYVSVIMTDKMRTEGEIAFQFLKTRSSDGVGNTIYLKWNRSSLRITDADSSSASPDPAIKYMSPDEKVADLSSSPSGNDLLELMSLNTIDK